MDLTDISRALGRVEQGVADIRTEFKKLNGSVQKHERRLKNIEVSVGKATIAGVIVGSILGIIGTIILTLINVFFGK